MREIGVNLREAAIAKLGPKRRLPDQALYRRREGLGRATTATVVHVTVGVIVSDFFLTKIFLMLFW